MKKLCYPIFTICCILLATLGKVDAQDARFSQFNQNPLHLNPALTGLFDGGLRLNLNYRTLFYSVLNDEEYISYSGSVENRFRIGSNFASFGAYLLQDQIGVSGFKRSYYNLSGAYHQRLVASGYNTPDMFLVLGAQIGMGQYSFDPASLWFSNQYDNTLLEIDRSIDPQEAFAAGGVKRFVDYNVGLLYFYSYPEGGSFYIGGALHHFSNPNVGFLENSEETLLSRYTAHAGGELILGEYFSFLPSGMVQIQGPIQSITAGGSIGLDIDTEKEINLRVGGHLHVTKRFDNAYQAEALIVSSIFEYNGWRIGLSYDVTLSSLNRSNFSRGAFEMSLSKIVAANYVPKIKCPKL